MAESERCLAVAHLKSPQGFGKEHVLMRLRLMEGRTEVAVLEIASAEELNEELVLIRELVGDWLFTTPHLRVHLWHDAAWWNLSDDLSQFFTWIIETGAGTPEETRAFTSAPLSRPDWLFEAAWQMKTLLEVATEMHPNES